ncbi:MAG: ATP-binding cassette domain-containing protein [Bacteroidales bacterium]|nr:ATP-binding cassette domain-containing protein [Bacteroidales bacterium]MCL2133616.1 ATP-binding cassette domain-containing protein [Bacteroidales bacterium]
MNLLIAEKIVKRYSNHLALNEVSIAVPKGGIFGLLGPNGAGKTTLIRIINQITAPDSGQVIFDGRPLQADDVYQIGYLPEERGLYKKMKVGEQALYLARLKGLSNAEAVAQLKVWFTKFGIQGWWNRKVEELSKGMAQKVQFIITILHQPKLLIFDEPFSGFDPVNVNLLKQEILRLKEKGSTIIFSTHNMASVEELCDNIALIDKSKVIVTGGVNEVRRNHGDNLVEILFRGDTGLDTLLTPIYSLVAQKEQNGLQAATVRINDPQPANQLLQQLIPHVEIHGFREIIPSMNDIFIKLVS